MATFLLFALTIAYYSAFVFNGLFNEGEISLSPSSGYYGISASFGFAFLVLIFVLIVVVLSGKRIGKHRPKSRRKKLK